MRFVEKVNEFGEGEVRLVEKVDVVGEGERTVDDGRWPGHLIKHR